VSGSTVGGSTSQQPATCVVDTEMEILAHLWWLLLCILQSTREANVACNLWSMTHIVSSFWIIVTILPLYMMLHPRRQSSPCEIIWLFL
jgi:hypothetical protein